MIYVNSCTWVDATLRHYIPLWQRGLTKVCMALIEVKAPVDVQDKDGKTQFHYAAEVRIAVVSPSL